MALDEELMRRAPRTGEAVFRVYGWSDPTLSLGRNQRARGLYDRDLASEMGISFVRRPTGGRALLHHREVTYSATLPLNDASEARAAYEFLNDVLIDGLGRLGVYARRAEGAHAIPPGPRPCFDLPSEHEIVVGDRKLVGSAQWRRDGALLQHGSILLHDDQPSISRLMSGVAPPGAATLTESLGRAPAFEEVADALLESLERHTGQTLRALAPDATMDAECRDLRHAYGDEAWTWRR